MNLSEADAGKIFWGVLAGSASAASDDMPSFDHLPLDVRVCVIQTAFSVYETGDALLGKTFCDRLGQAGWSLGRYNETDKTIGFGPRPDGEMTFGIDIMLRGAAGAIIATKGL